MKHNIILTTLVLFLAASFVIPSCQDYEFLDKPPGTDVTEDTVFNTVRDFEKFLAGTYMYGMHSYYPYHNQNGSVNPNPTMCMSCAIADEAEMSETWHSSQVWNSGSVQKNSIINDEDKRFHLRWQAIRRCNIIIERIPDTDFTTAEKNKFTAEAMFIRALNNFEMLKRYGAMPIVDKRLVEGDNWLIPRATFEDFVNYIVSDCDKAAELLKDVVWDVNNRGRVNYAAALTLKAKTLLYAASPLFNTDTPYITSSSNVHTCYPSYDAKRWELAADAADKALEACTAQGFSILDTDTPDEDYKDVFNVYDNQEIILSEKFAGKIGSWSPPWTMFTPKCNNMDGTWGVAVVVPQNFVARYEKKDGTPQTWNEPGVIGNDLMEKYAELEPRFKASICYNGSAFNANNPSFEFWEGSPMPANSYHVTGYIMRKIIPQTLGVGNDYQMIPQGILFRVAELYLNLAEALNEYSGPTADVYAAVNVVRDRAGLPGLPAGLSKEQMRERIKNERAIELSYEDHRLWDLRRWMDAENDGALCGDFYKMVVYKVSGTGLEMKCDYEIAKYETRTFHRKMYLHPIQESEVNKGYLVQNPGW